MRYLIILLSFFLASSSGPTEEELIKSAKSTVLRFVDELNAKNLISANEMYPSFYRVKKFYNPVNYEIRGVYFSDDKKEVKISGEFFFVQVYSDGSKREEERELQFVLSYKGSDKWEIIDSKGLSSFVESHIYNALSRSRCFEFEKIESDGSIHQDCLRYEEQFEEYVADYKRELEFLIGYDSKTTSINKSEGWFGADDILSGSVGFRNNSNVSVPAYSFKVYVSVNDGSRTIEEKELYAGASGFRPNGSLVCMLPATNINTERGQVMTSRVEIVNDEFLRVYLANQSTFPPCD